MTAPVDVVRSASGTHSLPVRFASAVGESPPRTRARTGLVVGVLAVAVAAVMVGAIQVTANIGYDEARAAFDDALTSAESTAAVVRQDVDELTAVADVADLLVQSDSGTLVLPAARDELSAAATAAGEVSVPAQELLGTDLPVARPKPDPFWDLFAASSELAAQTSDLQTLDRDLGDVAPSIADAATRVTDTGIALLASAAEAAPAFEAAHLSAKNDAVLALRNAASAASLTATLDESAVGALVTLQDAAAQVVATEQVELAEKAGPLQGARLEIEAFARSLAPGVLLEFDWNQIVNGAGLNGSMGGLTRWWWDAPDRATIELSNSVAEQWPSERSRALVAHEVGHAISVKCEDMYDSSTQDSIEKWATAWAISMGFTDDANGVWAYGYPPQSYIDAAYGCR
jgi:hypothetical protein